jgi:predicted alpha/beta hydrolase
MNGNGAATGQGVAIRIAARDGFELGMTVHGASGNAALVICGAMGVPQAYYGEFARYFSARGVAAITYDYRGVGASRPPGPLASVHVRIGDWARLDTEAVLRWAGERYPGRRIWVVAHSFGGQGLGLLTDFSKLERVVMVGSQTGCWSDFALRDRPRAWLGAHVLIPGLSHALGYFPGSKVGMGEDLPKGIALEWAKWIRSPRYLFDHLTAEEQSSYGRFSAPIMAYKISDDRFASGTSVEKLLRYYSAARIVLRRVTPRELGVPRIGHFGPFRSQFRASLWPEMYDWLAHGRAPALAAT